MVGSASEGMAELDAEMAALLASHNQKVRAKNVTYVAQLHSAKDVQLWCQLRGKKWHLLTPAERDAANNEIAQLKASGQL